MLSFFLRLAKVHNNINNVEAFLHFYRYLNKFRKPYHPCPALWGHEQWQSSLVIGFWRTRFPCRKYTKNINSFQVFFKKSLYLCTRKHQEQSPLELNSPTEFWKPRWSVRCGSNINKLQNIPSYATAHLLHQGCD